MSCLLNTLTISVVFSPNRSEKTPPLALVEGEKTGRKSRSFDTHVHFESSVINRVRRYTASNYACSGSMRSYHEPRPYARKRTSSALSLQHGMGTARLQKGAFQLTRIEMGVVFSEP